MASKKTVASVPNPAIKPIADWTPDEVQAYNLAHGDIVMGMEMQTDDGDVKALLTDLLPVLNEIHGGCDVCRNHFLERANAVLAADGVSWRYSRQYDSQGRTLLKDNPEGESRMADIVLVAVQ